MLMKFFEIKYSLQNQRLNSKVRSSSEACDELPPDGFGKRDQRTSPADIILKFTHHDFHDK